MISRLIPLLAMVAALLISACAAPNVKTRVWLPAEHPEATKKKTFAVMQFDGKFTVVFRDWWLGSTTSYTFDSGKNFSEELEAALADARGPDGKTYFTLVERKQLAMAVGELKLGQSGLVDPGKAARIGKMTGAKVLYTGTVKSDTFDDKQFIEKETYCAAEDKNGNCLKMATKDIKCVRRKGIFLATVKATDVQSSHLIFGKQVSGYSESKSCGKEGTLLGPTETRDAALKDAVRQVVWAVAPHEFEFSLELLEMTDGIISDASKTALSSGVDLAKRGRFEEACEKWKPAAVKEPKSAALLFDAGICFEVAQSYTEALSYYTRADRLVSDIGPSATSKVGALLPGKYGDFLSKAANPDKISQDAIKRVKDLIRKKEELARQS
jgi:hypothetical protein